MPTLSRRQLVTKLSSHFGNDLLVMQINDCVSLLCFRHSVPCHINTDVADEDEDNVAEHLAEHLRSEASQFQSKRIIKSTASHIHLLLWCDIFISRLSDYGWEISVVIPSPVRGSGTVGPPWTDDGRCLHLQLQLWCTMSTKKNCSCSSAGLSCTTSCKCEADNDLCQN